VALFRRYRGEHSRGGHRPDPEFTYLTEDQGARLRSLVREAFAEQGLEVTMHSGHVESADGGRFGLTNVAANCRASRERDWPRLIRQHVATILAAAERSLDPDDLDEAEVMQRVFVRIVGTSTVPNLSAFGYRRELGGDLVELLALDFPESVAMLTDEVVERFGTGPLRAAGVTNLVCEQFGSYERIMRRDGGWFGVVVGDSVYTASRLLTLDDVLRRTVGSIEAPYGVLACVPFRHQLAFHVIRDAGVLPMIESMAVFAASGFSDGIGPVSPFLYWSHGGRLTQLSYPAEDGGLRIDVDEEFAEVLDRLGVSEED
jgi:hypothetical protein